MKVDLGFWNQQGEYIQDIQEVNEMDIDKYFEELNDMANFKGFGEKPETEDEEIMIERLQQENAKLKAENERLKEEFEIESLTDNTTSEIYYRSNVCNKLRNKNLKLKKNLQEIKEIAEKYDNLTYPVSSIVLSQEILQKISEVME